MTTTTATLADWAEAHGVSMHATLTDTADDGARTWAATIYRNADDGPGRLPLDVPYFFMGSALTGPPDSLIVLGCLVSDARLADESTDAWELAAELGLPAGSRAECDAIRRTWVEMIGARDRLLAWAGDEYEALLELEAE